MPTVTSIYRCWGPYGADRGDYFAQQAVTIFDAAAIAIGAVVGFRLEKLIQQITVGGVNLHTVKPGLFGPFGVWI